MNSVNIYVNEKQIIFSPKMDNCLKISPGSLWLLSDTTEKKKILKSFNGFIKSKSERSVCIPGSIKRTMEIFSSAFITIEAAGGLIKKPGKGFLLIFRNGKWDLPKGKIDEGEHVRSAALRECEEECGVRGLKIIRKLPPTFHMYQLKKKWVLKKTHWFLMETDFSGKLVPQSEEGITKVKWVQKKDFPVIMKNTFPSVKNVLNEI